MLDIQHQVENIFTTAFGRTPLRQRQDDILGEAIELSRATDLKNLREEAGDLLASTLMLCTEAGWDAEALIVATLDKINNRMTQYRSLGRKTKVAILGGAYDLVTNGHIQIAQYVLNTSHTFDEVWLMPCYGHMFGKQMQSAEHRLAMCEIAAKKDGRIKVFDFEIANKLSSETYQTVKCLLETDMGKNTHDFSWIIGMDNANVFDKWVNYELLEKMIRFVVVPRQGYAFDPKVDWYLKPPHIYLGNTDKPIMEISSTEVKRRLRSYWNDPCDALSLEFEDCIDPEVFEYIKRNNLYQPTT